VINIRLRNILKLKAINEYIININKSLYSDIYHIVNPTLSRNPYMSNFLDYYLENKEIKKINFFKKTKLVCKYFIFLYIRYFIYCCKFIIYKINRKQAVFDNKVDFILDINFIVKNIIAVDEFRDSYLGSLDSVLEKSGYQTCYLVKSFLGSEFNLYIFFKIINILNKSNKNIITEFDILSLKDVIKIFIHSHVYPFKLLSIRINTGNDLVDKSIATSNIEALNSNIFTRFVRYYTGIRLSEIYKRPQIISNCEYKCHDKIFYKGVKDTNPNIFIYGCQFFVDYPVWLNTKIPKEEKKFNVTPDIVLTNGIVDLAKHGIDSELGVSLRYDTLFNNKKYLNISRQILILLSFDQGTSKHLLKLCSRVQLLDKYKVVVRAHPALDIKKLKKIIPASWIVDSKTTLEKQFECSSMVIVSGSGSAVEAAVKGVSIIIVGNNNTFVSNPLSDKLGKKIIWDEAYSVEELSIAINNLMQIRKSKIDEILILSEIYLKQYFTEPNKENIKRCFIKK
jgi:hypothetical protein